MTSNELRGKWDGGHLNRGEPIGFVAFRRHIDEDDILEKMPSVISCLGEFKKPIASCNLYQSGSITGP